MSMAAAQIYDLDALRRAPLNRDPFDFVVVPGFLTVEGREAVGRDFPRIERPGNFYLEQLRYGPGFETFLGAMADPAFTVACGEKFGIDLMGRARLVSVRALSGPLDGDIHTDHVDKIVTILIYLNESWEAEGGRLRLLRSPDDLDDVAVEVPPVAGTLIAFRRSDNSYHGHKRHMGPRRVIQINYLRDGDAAQRRQRQWKPVTRAFRVMMNRVRGVNRH
jgi:hypothetical protein